MTILLVWNFLQCTHFRNGFAGEPRATRVNLDHRFGEVLNEGWRNPDFGRVDSCDPTFG
jgi:hypothetical protein